MNAALNSNPRRTCLTTGRLTTAFLGLLATPAFAADGGLDTGDTAFIFICSALVMLMTPGLALFYAGMVRRKNVLGTIMHSYVSVALMSVVWVLWGYSLAFGPDLGSFIGSLKWFGLNGVGPEPSSYAGTIPHYLFMAFQMMFAIITPALISGAIAERIKFSTYLVFLTLWSSLVYSVICHWVWGGGWLGSLGALDFAGGTVVHISSGVSGLVAALVLGRRRNLQEDPPVPHNMTMTVLGTGMLWFGWFGFNAGSALAADGLAMTAFVTTNTAAAVAALTWLLVEWKVRGNPTVLGFASGAVAGLVGITPAAGFVTPVGALVIGVSVALICFWAVAFKEKLGYDDSLDAFGIHGVGGTWGAIATGLLATTAVNAGGANGLFYGNPGLLWVQVVGVVATAAYAAAVTFVLLKVLDRLMGLRVSEDHESLGLDISQHDERGYVL